MSIMLHPGTRRDERDPRDRRFRPSIARLPVRADLSADCGPVFTQRHIYSCSANALASALMLIRNRAGAPIKRPSRLFMYYNARALLGEARKDAGTTVRSAIKALARYGACPETLWPYLVGKVLHKPPGTCYRRGEVHALVYQRISRKIEHLHACLAQGDPFIFGIQAYMQPFSAAAKSAFLELPSKSDTLCGGHALVAVGYDRKKNAVLARNSLGPKYGRDGFFWIDQRYFTDPNLSFDFWRIIAAE